MRSGCAFQLAPPSLGRSPLRLIALGGRAGLQVSGHVRSVATQRHQVDEIHGQVEVEPAARAWRPNSATRDRLAAALDRLAAALVEHMDYEEKYVVPLIEAHIGLREWNPMVQSIAADMDPRDAVLALGMIMYECDSDIIEQIIGNMPAEIRSDIKTMAARVYAQHAQLIHGTLDPAAQHTNIRH